MFYNTAIDKIEDDGFLIDSPRPMTIECVKLLTKSEVLTKWP